jgi:hypothetical protein
MFDDSDSGDGGTIGKPFLAKGSGPDRHPHPPDVSAVGAVSIKSDRCPRESRFEVQLVARLFHDRILAETVCRGLLGCRMRCVAFDAQPNCLRRSCTPGEG